MIFPARPYRVRKMPRGLGYMLSNLNRFSEFCTIYFGVWMAIASLAWLRLSCLHGTSQF